ncbi:hypothetical protein IPH19_01885 [Candidatus Uhrbacteria bacterium]|nr:MAG: hypothetical protein IPH19_01885 [Candidatus Uhrbacteria bacterium]
MSERLVRELLSATYPRIRQAGKGWALESAPDVLTPVPNPEDKLAYVLLQAGMSKEQIRNVQIALQKLVPVPPDPATIFYLEHLL